MTAGSYLRQIWKKHNVFLLMLTIGYLSAWGYSYWASTIDGERPSVAVALIKFVLLTALLLSPSVVIFCDSLRRQKYAGGYVVAGLVLNIYALGAYWFSKTRRENSEQCADSTSRGPGE
jgi:hypothetical protein